MDRLGSDLVAALRPAGLAGVRIEAAEFTPDAIEGVSPNPQHEGVALSGIRFVVTESLRPRPDRPGRRSAGHLPAPGPEGSSIIVDPASFDLVAGSGELRIRIERGDPAAQILDSMAEPLAQFLELRDSVLLYQ